MNRRILFLPALLLLVSPALAHVRLIEPKARTTQSLKVAPCGGIARTASPLVLTMGEEIEVVWDEFTEHPGYHRILFSLGGDRDFQVLADQIPDKVKPSTGAAVRYSMRVKLPSVACTSCTLQLIQVMTENPQSPTLYFSCADVRLVPPPEPFRRGDATADGDVNLADCIATLEYLFTGGAGPTCPSAADSNDDSRIDLTDGITTLFWLFADGASIPEPGPLDCGKDPSADLLGCPGYPAACQ